MPATEYQEFQEAWIEAGRNPTVYNLQPVGWKFDLSKIPDPLRSSFLGVSKDLEKMMFGNWQAVAWRHSPTDSGHQLDFVLKSNDPGCQRRQNGMVHLLLEPEYRFPSEPVYKTPSSKSDLGNRALGTFTTLDEIKSGSFSTYIEQVNLYQFYGFEVRNQYRNPEYIFEYGFPHIRGFREDPQRVVFNLSLGDLKETRDIDLAFNAYWDKIKAEIKPWQEKFPRPDAIKSLAAEARNQRKIYLTEYQNLFKRPDGLTEAT